MQDNARGRARDTAAALVGLQRNACVAHQQLACVVKTSVSQHHTALFTHLEQALLLTAAGVSLEVPAVQHTSTAEDSNSTQAGSGSDAARGGLQRAPEQW